MRLLKIVPQRGGGFRVSAAGSEDEPVLTIKIEAVGQTKPKTYPDGFAAHLAPWLAA